MKHLRRTFMLVGLAVLAIIFVSCTLPQGDQEDPNGPVDSNLLGRWLSAAGSSFEFKSDNTLAVVLTTGGSPISYKYDATGGSGHYWVAGTPKAAAQPFTYSIAGSALALKFAGIDYSLLKEGTALKSVYAVGLAFTQPNIDTAQAYYWKDNVPTKLETPAGATKGVYARHMYAVGSTTYITR
ncbi:hypothetical protein LWX53_10155, partial [bacterium]|nr:hypothetical protein [bacterium]